MNIEIIYEDEWMCVVNKPAGMIVNEADTVKDLTIQKWFSEKYNINEKRDDEFYKRGGVVHRLDKDTSGILVLAKTPEAYEGLKKQFLERVTVKKYRALVHGEMKETTGELSTPIERNPVDKKKFCVGKDLSRTAITEWRVLEEFSIFNFKFSKISETLSLMELIPHTGRTHQLRVHMQYLHHPIVSDPIYGYQKTWKQDLEWCPRLFLHAGYLQIKHPENGKTLEFSCALTADLEQVLAKLVD